MAGYSGTPLWKKLGLKPGFSVYAHKAPLDYQEMLGLEKLVPVRWLKRPLEGVNVVHAFFKDLAELRKLIPQYRQKLAPDGMIWVSWPKKSSGMASDITEQSVRDVALPTGLVDVKVCAVDETWSGLKLVIRKELRMAK